MNTPFTPPFPPADKSAWLNQVQKELKTGTYDEMRWRTDDGLTLEPYYTADDLSSLPLTRLQGVQKPVPGWLNAPERLITHEKADNPVLRETLTRGADALVLTLTDKPNLSVLLNGIKLSETPVFFRFAPDAVLNTVDLVRALKRVAPYQLKGGLLLDAGNETAEVTRQTADSSLFRTVYVSTHDFHNAGATATQELAFMLAKLVDVYDILTDGGLTMAQVVPKTMLSVSVGTSYFLEIAKLRALRVLMGRLLSAYLAAPPLSVAYGIHGQTSTFYDALATPYINLLRSTTEAMAAVVGGCDALTVHPYTTVSGKQPDSFSERIARNVSVLLKEESSFDKVADPSAGSYYIETLTNQLAEAGWALFLAVEQRGGYKKAMVDGFISSEINRAYRAKVEAVQTGQVLVGVTKFRDTAVTESIEKAAQPTGELPNRRLAGEFE